MTCNIKPSLVYLGLMYAELYHRGKLYVGYGKTSRGALEALFIKLRFQI